MISAALQRPVPGSSASSKCWRPVSGLLDASRLYIEYRPAICFGVNYIFRRTPQYLQYLLNNIVKRYIGVDALQPPWVKTWKSMQKNSARRATPLEMAFPDTEAVPVYIINTCFDVRERVGPESGDEITLPAGADSGLSVRALNVLKILADEVTGEIASRAAWVPSDALLRKITTERLSLARNCGPRTVDEIVRWAAARGVTIRPLFHAGKSLSEAWRDLGTRFSAGELTKEELTEALEKSVRRKSTKIPVGVQRILLKYLRGQGDGQGRG
jgi:hypothetical protein